MLAILLQVQPYLGFFKSCSQVIRQRPHNVFKKEKVLRFSSHKEHALILEQIVKLRGKHFYTFSSFFLFF